jgi:hypothetical protein
VLNTIVLSVDFFWRNASGCASATAMANGLSRNVDALPGLVWTALLDGRIEFVNRPGCKYSALSVEQGRARAGRRRPTPATARAARILEDLSSPPARGQAEA